ncbi:MAG TPA: 5-(carboxyamino)imidazole ribonucleotide mutase [Polyangiales bacterium]
MNEASKQTPRVAVVMGSLSDHEVVKPALTLLDELRVPHEAAVVSAHRTPVHMSRFAQTAEERGLRVILAAAGGAAHLPGMIAAHTVLPVLGIPVPATTLLGIDSLLSIVQMPRGVPVGTLAIGSSGAHNAALLAAQILALEDAALRKRLKALRLRAETESLAARLPAARKRSKS